MRIKLVSDIHGAADALAREAAGADALLVCGDLVNLIDYRTMEGIAADVFGPEATRDFVRHRTAGRFEEAGQVLRSASEGREDQVPDQFQDLLRPGVRHLDGETVELDGLRVGFVGGGLPRGSRPHLSEITHEAFAAKVAALGPVDVVCSHMPPAVDDLRFDVVAGRPEPGSQALLDYVEEHQPEYLYFGHVHQPRRARLRIGRTWLVNLGYFRATGRMLDHPA
jgi:Icc-related predicted phosphoesterase